MRTERFEVMGAGGMKLPSVLFLPEGEPVRIVQIAHGMTEHIGRYEAFAGALTAQGIAVAGYDLRGHGRNPGNREAASFGEGGWAASLEDMRLFFEHLSARFPGVPHDMLGFSLGSFLLREYLGRWSEGVSRAVIMGTGHQSAPVLSVMMAIVRGQIKKGGFDNTTDLVRKLSFGTYNQKFRPNRTSSDWLCADEAQLDAYLADPLCRGDISSGLFWDLLGAMKRTGSQSACSTWNREMPVLLISGQDDPVGDNGKGVKAVKKQLDAAGMKDVSLHLIPGARHVLLSECSSGTAEKATGIIVRWLLA
ncbi:MAG: lysophospholipase [Clostridia bacterium]|nr:lysophospholipase [Clostridia bacterium]